MKWTSRADSRCVNDYVRCLILWDMTIHYLINTSRNSKMNVSIANESWGRILLKYGKENIKLKKPYTPFPSPQQPSKNDPELQSGEYSLNDKKKSAKKRQEKPNKQSKKVGENKRKREVASIPPKVPIKWRKGREIVWKSKHCSH